MTGNPKSSWRSRLLALLALLALAGCGQVSLMNLLEAEAPGEFTVQPGTAALVEGTSVDILPQGGFRPYGLQLLDDTGDKGALVEGVYTAPDDVGFGLTVQIEATDAVGTEPVVSTLKVYARLRLTDPSYAPVSAVVLQEGETFSFRALGGSGPYDYYVDDYLQEPPDVRWFEDWDFTGWPAGIYQVEVEDSQGMRAGAAVTVVAANPTVLAISPTEAVATAGGATVDFAVSVPLGHGYTVSTDLGSVVGIDAITWRYTPPGAAGTATVTLTDTVSSESVTATVTVVELTPTGDPLAISPAALSNDLAPGEQVVFTASGGTPGVPPLPAYSFRIDPDELMGTLEVIAPNKVRYTATESANNLDWLRLTDAVGASVRVKIKSKL